jgi:transmembrane sensor
MGDRMSHASVPAGQEPEGDTTSALDRLGAEVSSSLAKAIANVDASARVRAKLVAREAPRIRKARTRVHRGRVAAVAGAALALAAALFLVWGALPRHSSLSFRVASPEGRTEKGVIGAFLAAPPGASVPLTFSDGSQVELSPRARARIASLEENGARVLVESGTLHVSVVHREKTRWSVEAGPYEVRVTGTRFDVAFDPSDESLVLKLEEGSVVVTGCNLGAERRLAAGEELRSSCRAPAAAPAPPTASTPAPQPEPDRASPHDALQGAAQGTLSPTALPDAPARAPAPVAAPVAAPKEQEQRARDDTVADLVHKGKHAEAVAEAEARGFDATCESLSSADLLALAGAARYAGRFDRATSALDAVRRRFPKSDGAATAAFELGRIAFDARRDFAAAGDWFDTYLRERPAGGFAREALGRAIEARQRAGDHARARELASRYLARYPDGPHASLAGKLAASSVGDYR